MIVSAPILLVFLFVLLLYGPGGSSRPPDFEVARVLSFWLIPLSQFAAGIIGLANWRRPDRAYVCFVAGLVALASLVLLMGICVLGGLVLAELAWITFAFAVLCAIAPLIYTTAAYKRLELGRKIRPVVIGIVLLVPVVALLVVSDVEQAHIEHFREAWVQREARLDALLEYPPIPLRESEIVISEIQGLTISASGWEHSYVILPDGSLWGTGANVRGLLGDGTETDRCSPVWIMDDVAAIDFGSQRGMAIRTDGSLWGWGTNGHGQLGDGSTETRTTPVPIMDEVVAVSVSSRSRNTMAIRADGSLWAFGESYRAVPVRILDDVVSVSTGTEFAMAIRTDGSLWGWDSRRRPGVGITEARPEPVMILEDVTAVSTGDWHTMALSADGTLWAWGSNYQGQLGDGTTEGRYNPVRIMDEVIAISAVGATSHAIRADGTLWAWGSNRHGQVGDGTMESRSAPVMVLEDVVAVSGGSSHTLAIRADGSLWAWGSNSRGQLGDGTREDRHNPVRIMDNVMLPQ